MTFQLGYYYTNRREEYEKRNLMTKVLIPAFVYISMFNMPFNVMASSTGTVSSGTEESEVSILGEGKSGDITWKVDSNGVLSLTGNGDYVAKFYSQLPWHSYIPNITSAIVDISGITNTSYMFYGCSNLTNLDVSSFDTSNVTYMGGMFCACDKLIKLDINNFDTSKATSIE